MQAVNLPSQQPWSQLTGEEPHATSSRQSISLSSKDKKEGALILGAMLLLTGASIFLCIQAKNLYDHDYLSGYAAKYGPSILEFDPNDDRDKIGLLMGFHDPSKAFSPTLSDPWLATLNQTADLALFQFRSLPEICNQLSSWGNSTLAGLVLFGHGNPSKLDTLHLFDKIPTFCLSALKPNATILLDSCRTAAPQENSLFSRPAIPNFAEWFLSEANRHLVSSADSTERNLSLLAATGTVRGKCSRLTHPSKGLKGVRFYDFDKTTNECNPIRDITAEISPQKADQVVRKYQADTPAFFKWADKTLGIF